MLWCNDAGLQLTTEKTEVISLTGKRIPKIFNIEVGGGKITTKEEIKYMGVTLDNAIKYSSHLEKTCNKAERLANAIRGLLLNVNRPADLMRKLYYGVWESVVLYAAPI